MLEQTLGAAVTAGDFSRAITLTRAGLAEVDADQAPLRAARLLDQRGRLMALLGKSDGGRELDEAYRLAAGGSPGVERVRLLADIATHLVKIDPRKAARVAAEAGTDAEALGADVALLSTRIALLCHGERDLERGLAELGRVAAAARAAGTRRPWCSPWCSSRTCSASWGATPSPRRPPRPAWPRPGGWGSAAPPGRTCCPTVPRH
ncbi:hypothetical protein NKG94_46715 [Micromonospora sp. M12]